MRHAILLALLCGACAAPPSAPTVAVAEGPQNSVERCASIGVGMCARAQRCGDIQAQDGPSCRAQALVQLDCMHAQGVTPAEHAACTEGLDRAPCGGMPVACFGILGDEPAVLEAPRGQEAKQRSGTSASHPVK